MKNEGGEKEYRSGLVQTGIMYAGASMYKHPCAYVTTKIHLLVVEKSQGCFCSILSLNEEKLVLLNLVKDFLQQ